jgi:polar amino acid transport system substrate-binding protein
MKKNSLLTILGILIIIIIGAWIWYQNFPTADASLANLKKRGVLIVGSDIPYGVMEFFTANNQPAGIDVDVAQEIASRLGLKLEFNGYGWDQLFFKVKNGEIDLAISSITITPERQTEMLFSNSYFNGGQVIVVRADNQEIKGVNNLMAKKIAVQKDTTGYSEAKKYTLENLISTYLNFNDPDGGASITTDLKNGQVDAIIVDYIQALSLIKSDPGLKIVGVPFTEENYGIATKLGNDSLMKKINSILSDIKEDGTLKKIEDKWTRF